jgi:hypothetical protein
MVYVPTRSVLAAFFVAAALAGCSAAPMMEGLPASVGGLPADAPAQPTTPYQYPAVHDMPPPRATKPMSEEELYTTEKALNAARDRQEGQEKAASRGAPAAKKKALPVAKKKPADGKKGGTADAKASVKTNP